MLKNSLPFQLWKKSLCNPVYYFSHNDTCRDKEIMKRRKLKLSILITIRNDPEQIPRELHSDITQSHHGSVNFY